MTQADVATSTQRVERVVSGIDEDTIVALAEELIRAGGENPGGTEEATVVSLSGALASMGARIEFDEVAPGRSNLIARLGGGPTDSGGLLFLGHSDVVPAGAGWTGDPFDPRRDGDRLVGRGAADMKGGLAAVVVAMSAVHAEAPEIPMTLLVTVDEECDAAGAQHYVASAPEGTYSGCVVAEPTGLRIITACRGATNLTLEVAGASAHAGNPDDGASAILAAGDVMRAVEQDDAALRTRPNPELGRASWNIGMIRGGHGTSIVADRCELALDRRTLPGEIPDEILSGILADAAAEIRRRGRAGTDLITVTGSVDMVMPGFTTDPGSGFVLSCQDAVRRAGGTGETGVWSAACEGGFIAQAHDVPTVVLGPGDVAQQAHQPDESVEVAELLAAARAYAGLALQSQPATAL